MRYETVTDRTPHSASTFGKLGYKLLFCSNTHMKWTNVCNLQKERDKYALTLNPAESQSTCSIFHYSAQERRSIIPSASKRGN